MITVCFYWNEVSEGQNFIHYRPRSNTSTSGSGWKVSHPSDPHMKWLLILVPSKGCYLVLKDGGGYFELPSCKVSYTMKQLTMITQVITSRSPLKSDTGLLPVNPLSLSMNKLGKKGVLRQEPSRWGRTKSGWSLSVSYPHTVITVDTMDVTWY